MTWSPSAESRNDVPFWVAPPSTVYEVDATPERASAGDRVTVTLLFVQLFDAPPTPVTGGVLSMLTGELTPVPVLPALSDTDALAVRLLPSPEIVPSPGAVAGSMPERSSAALQWIVTLPLYQPLPFAPVVGAPLTVGLTRSMLMALTVADAPLPATSETLPVT